LSRVKTYLKDRGYLSQLLDLDVAPYKKVPKFDSMHEDK
jgi:hypothetical protein